MSGASHTPGSYRVAHVAFDAKNWAALNDGEARPCVLVTNDDLEVGVLAVVWHGDAHDDDKAEAEANAHLFAGAGDLLKALRRLVEHVDHADQQCRKVPRDHLGNSGRRLIAIVDEARAAIAKSEGRP